METVLQGTSEARVHGNSGLQQSTVDHNATNSSQRNFTPRHTKVTQPLPLARYGYSVADTNASSYYGCHRFYRLVKSIFREKRYIYRDLSNLFFRIKTVLVSQHFNFIYDNAHFFRYQRIIKL